MFDEVADALRGMIPDALGEPHQRARQYGIKVWFGSDAPAREHYEAQVIGAEHVDDATVLAIEVGFHAEFPRAADNDKVIDHFMGNESRWRKKVGAEARAGAFLGRTDVWQRISEAWPDPDLDDPELPFALAARLTDYITALEPLRRER